MARKSNSQKLIEDTVDDLMNNSVNVGEVDRIARGGIAALVFALAGNAKGFNRLVLRLLALGLGFTAATGHCPVYDRMDVNTVKDWSIKNIKKQLS